MDSREVRANSQTGGAGGASDWRNMGHGGYARARDETGKGMKGRGEGRRSIGVGGSRE